MQTKAPPEASAPEGAPATPAAAAPAPVEPVEPPIEPSLETYIGAELYAMRTYP